MEAFAHSFVKKIKADVAHYMFFVNKAKTPEITIFKHCDIALAIHKNGVFLESHANDLSTDAFEPAAAFQDIQAYTHFHEISLRKCKICILFF